MQLLAIQKCIEIKQEVTPIEKRIVEYSYEMELYDEEIVVKEVHYSVTNIFDISYRIDENSQTKKIGYIYLHTSHGVRTFFIKDEPSQFINAYLKLKAGRTDMQ